MCSLCIASLKGPPIGGQENDRVSYLCSAPYTLLPLRGISPQGETRDMREKNSESYTSGIISAFSPFGGWATTFSPQAGALWMLSHEAMSLQESIERFILPPEQGEVRRSRIGGGERSEPIRRMLIMPYDTESISRNADFILIARKGDTTTLGPKGRQTYEPSGRQAGPS